MRKIFVHGLSALDLIHTVSDLPKYAEKYKSNSVYVSIGGNAANASVAPVSYTHLTLPTIAVV